MKQITLFSILITALLSCYAYAGINCDEVVYGKPNYMENMGKLATEAKLPDNYYSKYHQEVVSKLCKGEFIATDRLIDYGYIKAKEVEAIAAVLGKQYKAPPRSEAGKIYEKTYLKLLEFGATKSCASNAADEYVRKKDSSVGKLVQAALAGDKDALKVLKELSNAKKPENNKPLVKEEPMKSEPEQSGRENTNKISNSTSKQWILWIVVIACSFALFTYIYINKSKRLKKIVKFENLSDTETTVPQANSAKSYKEKNIKSWEQPLNEIGEFLNLSVVNMKPAERGLLGLLKSSIELVNLSDEPEKYLKNIKPYFDILTSDCDEELLKNIFYNFRETQKTEWITEYPEDIEAEFPKMLFIWGLININLLVSNNSNTWAYIDKIEKDWDIKHEDISSFHGWITGSADNYTVNCIEGYIDTFKSSNNICSKLVKIFRPTACEGNFDIDDIDFLSIREKIQNKLNESNTYFVPLNLDNSTSLITLKEYLKNDGFRLAVLGEFKRGKSTFINALVGQPGLMPTDSLPCTSALTEIKYGDNILYEVNADANFSSFQPSDIQTFQKKAASAAIGRTSKDNAEKEAERVPRWRVSIPSSFLKNSFISIIDSPGIGEDYGRDKIAIREAERADAAIIVLNVDQATSLQELELIEKMKSKASHLIIAVNRADLKPESELDKIKYYIAERINSITNAIPEDNIVLISALKAEQAIKNGSYDDIWLSRLHHMQEVIHNHVVKNAGPIKLGQLKDKVSNFIKDYQERIDNYCFQKEIDFNNIQNRKKVVEDAKEQYEQAKHSVETGEKILKNCESQVNQFIKFFSNSLPEILKTTESKKENWTSEYNSFLHPQKHVEEIAKKAQQDLLDNFAIWMKDKGSTFILELIDKKYQEAENKLFELKAYLQKTTGVDGIRQIEQIKKQVFIDTFGDINFEMSGGIVGGLALTGALSAVIGYVIADIVLYYLLSLISGFLNPFLLAGAVIAALGIAFFSKKGIKSIIRDKVFSKIKEGLQSDTNKTKINNALKQAVSDIFNLMARAFYENASGVLNEAKVHQKLREQELEQFINSTNITIESIEAEMSKVRNNSDKAKKVLNELQQCVR